MSYLHPTLVAFPALLLLGLPLLIHLIHLLRHRRVKWAAMDFLRESHQRNRKWIMLRQWLLLLVRTAVVGLLLLMLAQPILRTQWGDLLGGKTTHHIVLLDDSFSMSDRGSDTSAFDRAQRVVQKILRTAVRRGGGQSLSLVRFSRASSSNNELDAEWISEPLDDGFLDQLARTFSTMRVSATDAGPVEALQSVEHLPAKTEDEARIVYLVSDFRANQWKDAAALKRPLMDLNASDTQIHLVQCVQRERSNLAITKLSPTLGTRAAAVELVMEIGVRNFGTSAAEKVVIRLEEDGHPRPALVVDKIAPEETITRSFRVQFSSTGFHTITAHADADAVAIDNSRYCVLQLEAAHPVLLVDAGADARDAYFVATALAPGGNVRTGLRPVVESPRSLRNADELQEYSAVYVFNLDRLDAAEINTLEEYVKEGGGLAFFLGEQCRPAFFNEHLYGEGKGLFPVPIGPSTDLLRDPTQEDADLSVEKHPVFAVFAGQRNSFLRTVTVERYFPVLPDWEPTPDSTVRIIARLRNGDPFAVEKTFGKGRVVAILSKASPEVTNLGTWNNWGRNNPTYVVTLLQLHSYLSTNRMRHRVRYVGEPLTVAWSSAQFRPQARFTVPHELGTNSITIDAESIGDQRRVSLAETPSSGIYELRLATPEGSSENRSYAYNVHADEGNLQITSRKQLAARLAGVDYKYHLADELDWQPLDVAGFNLRDILLYLLVGMLLGEQLLAYLTSYHPNAPRGSNP